LQARAVGCKNVRENACFLHSSFEECRRMQNRPLSLAALQAIASRGRACPVARRVMQWRLAPRSRFSLAPSTLLGDTAAALSCSAAVPRPDREAGPAPRPFFLALPSPPGDTATARQNTSTAAFRSMSFDSFSTDTSQERKAYHVVRVEAGPPARL
jgi:hypothetical protein